jgi:uncharacterized protein YcbK (DUF882 family)
LRRSISIKERQQLRIDNRHSSGIAENSLHLVGKAIDIRIPGRQLGALRKAAIALQGGGVGYYPKSDFVHIDVGRVRHW